jgi:type II secretory pathway pseudopilin PulG
MKTKKRFDSPTCLSRFFWKKRAKKKFPKREKGFVLIAVLVLLTAALFLTGAALTYASNARVAVAATRQSDFQYLDAEATAQEAYSWLNQYSADWGSLFSGGVFTTTFTRSAEPSIGSNDNGPLPIPTRIKILGTNNSLILNKNENVFGPAVFPPTTNLVSGAAFQPIQRFAATEFRRGLPRITLIDAIPLDPGNLSATEYSPVFRIDAIRAPNRGGHVTMYVTGKMQTASGSGFVGRRYLEMRQSCDSYQSSRTIPSYSTSRRRANCPIASEGTINIHSNTTIFGSATTKGALATSSPFGGSLCASFACGCPVKGTVCANSSCSTPVIKLTPSSFAAACPNSGANLTISSGSSDSTAWTIESTTTANPTTNTPAGIPSKTYRNNCWNNLKVNSGNWVRFRAGLNGSAPTAFYIKQLDLANNSTILFDDNGGKQITLYVEQIVGNSYNGNQLGGLKIKSSGTMVAPNMLKVNYWGTAPLTLNGTATMNSFLVAPNAAVSISGNFTYNGGIMADRLTATGSGALHYDETGGNAVNVDMQLRLRSINEYYR